MNISNFILKNSYGKDTVLDKHYTKLINNVLLNSSEEEEIKWETYNLIISELINLNDCDYFSEIKYRLTDGENPNFVLIDVLSRYKQADLSHLVHILMKRVEDYADEDFFKRFY
jgi:hypothetical protein